MMIKSNKKFHYISFDKRFCNRSNIFIFIIKNVNHIYYNGLTIIKK